MWSVDCDVETHELLLFWRVWGIKLRKVKQQRTVELRQWGRVERTKRDKKKRSVQNEDVIQGGTERRSEFSWVRWPGSSWRGRRYRAVHPGSPRLAGCWRRWSSHTEVVGAHRFSEHSGCCERPCPLEGWRGRAWLFCVDGVRQSGMEAGWWWGGWWCPGSLWSRCTSSRPISPGF